MKIILDKIKNSTSTPRNDGVLHYSSHLTHARHTALYYHHGYPSIPMQSWAGTLPLMQGTAIHNEIHNLMMSDGLFYEPEVPVGSADTEYTWSGTADAYLYDEDDNFWLVDYKTISGAGLTFLNEPKYEHLLQVSAYYHFGTWKPHRVGILYLPTSVDYKRQMHEPIFYEVEPLPRTTVISNIHYMEDAINQYAKDGFLHTAPDGEYKWKQNKRNKCYDLTYKPYYGSLYCPWRYEEDDPCGCSKDKSRKIGSWSKEKGVIEGDENEVLSHVAEEMLEEV